MSVAFIILAAGKGSRMKSDLPKVLHSVAGAPLVAHALRSAAPLDPEHVIVVAGHGADLVRAAVADFAPDAQIVLQAEQNGTAHAVDMARAALASHDGDAIVLYGDTPFITSDTLEQMITVRETSDVVVLGFEAADPGKYGRLVTHGDTLKQIVEWKDATAEQRDITLCNSGVICADNRVMFDLISKISNDNAAKEYYLTDIVGLATQAGLRASVVTCDEAETLGINTVTELAAAKVQFQASTRARLLEDGVQFDAADSVHFAYDTEIGSGACIEPYVVFAQGVTVESGARIRAFSHLEDCHVARGAVVGPYARIRPGAELQEDVRIGNFVEVKNATLAQGAKVNHLSYIGDATIGPRTNVGAGTITCNYDGVLKHCTTIGADAFIGSNTMLVAPVTVGDEAMTASGSVITTDVPSESLAIARANQVNKPGLAVKLMDRLRAIKARKKD